MDFRQFPTLLHRLFAHVAAVNKAGRGGFLLPVPPALLAASEIVRVH